MIRPYRPTDRAAVYDICTRTAASGGDARGIHSTDDLMPDVWAGPYVDLEPETAYVVDEGDGAVGYIIGTADTRSFVERYRARWLPFLIERYPDPSPVDAPVVAMGLDADRMLIPEVDAYPAHLHIDLLPEIQGKGFGRRLIDHFRAELAARSVAAVHLSVDPANTAARAFYDRLDFGELPSGVLGIPTSN